jgi:hypothetical protein
MTTDPEPRHWPDSDHTRQAVAAIRQAVAAEDSFPEWLAHVLATAISDHEQGRYALIASRPDCVEATFIGGLMTYTVGDNDEALADHRDWPGGPDDPYVVS